MIGIHDNTSANKRNPDPNMWVGFGERSVDDMLQAWINVVYFDEAEFNRSYRSAGKTGESAMVNGLGLVLWGILCFVGNVATGNSSHEAEPRKEIKGFRVFAFSWLAFFFFRGWAFGPVRGQAGAKNGEWRAYGGDLGHTRYSPLDQITAANFKNLDVAWRFKTDPLGARPEFQFESTPLEVNGVLYSTAGTRRAVVALDAATGEELWVHSEREGDRGAAAPRQLSGRGLAYWTDGREERILYVTPGYMLVALNAKTGMRVPASARTAWSISSKTTTR